MRYIVIGTSGSGKTAFANALARALDCPMIELDELYWGPDWQARPADEFTDRVRATASVDRWVIDGNYSVVREILWSRATHVIWLNYAFHLVIWRVLSRTISRSLTGQTLWHGNRESLKKAFCSRESIILWSATTFAKNQRRYSALRAQNVYPRLCWQEFRRPAKAEAYLRAIARPDG